MGNKGALWIWLSALVAITFISFMYLIMNQILYSTNGIYQIVNQSVVESPINTTDQQTTMTRVKAVLDYWPLIAIAGILVWAFARSQWPEERQIG